MKNKLLPKIFSTTIVCLILHSSSNGQQKVKTVSTRPATQAAPATPATQNQPLLSDVTPIDPSSQNLVSDINNSFTAMEQSIEVEYAKLAKQMKDQIVALQDQIKSMNAQIESLKEMKASLEHELSVLVAANSLLPADQKKIVDVNAKIKANDDQTKTLQAQIEANKNKIKTLEKELEDLTKEKVKAIQELEKEKKKAIAEVTKILESKATSAQRNELIQKVNNYLANYFWK